MREQAGKGGLRFEVYLPSGLAEWVLGLVAQGVFANPSEAVFVMMGEQQDLAPHADLRREILKRSIDASMADRRPGIPLEEMRTKIRAWRDARAEPAVWVKTDYSE